LTEPIRIGKNPPHRGRPIGEGGNLRPVRLDLIETIATDTHQAGSLSSPIDAKDLAALHDLILWPRPEEDTGPGFVRYDPDAPQQAQQETIASQVAVNLLRAHNLPYYEVRWVETLTRALLLPAIDFRADLVHGWYLEELETKYPHVSSLLLAQRITDVEHAVCTLLCGVTILNRTASPWLPDTLCTTTQFERRLADKAARKGRTVRISEHCFAAPLFTRTPNTGEASSGFFDKTPHLDQVIVVSSWQLLGARD